MQWSLGRSTTTSVVDDRLCWIPERGQNLERRYPCCSHESWTASRPDHWHSLGYARWIVLAGCTSLRCVPALFASLLIFSRVVNGPLRLIENRRAKRLILLCGRSCENQHQHSDYCWNRHDHSPFHHTPPSVVWTVFMPCGHPFRKTNTCRSARPKSAPGREKGVVAPLPWNRRMNPIRYVCVPERIRVTTIRSGWLAGKTGTQSVEG